MLKGEIRWVCWGAKEKDIGAALQMLLTRVRWCLQRHLNYTSLTRKVAAAEADVVVSLDLFSLFWLLSAAAFIDSSKDDLYSVTDDSYLEQTNIIFQEEEWIMPLK